MDRFLVESPHTDDDCRSIVKSVYAYGYLNNCEWGCKGGVHKAWVIIEAEDESQALFVVPPSLRQKATVVKIAKFDPSTIKGWTE